MKLFSQIVYYSLQSNTIEIRCLRDNSIIKQSDFTAKPVLTVFL